MCDICRKTPCVNRCPNAEPPVVFNCENCGNDISVGDEYIKVGYKIYCMDCCSTKTAEFDDIETEDYP